MTDERQEILTGAAMTPPPLARVVQLGEEFLNLSKEDDRATLRAFLDQMELMTGTPGGQEAMDLRVAAAVRSLVEAGIPEEYAKREVEAFMQRMDRNLDRRN